MTQLIFGQDYEVKMPPGYLQNFTNKCFKEYTGPDNTNSFIQFVVNHPERSYDLKPHITSIEKYYRNLTR